MNKDRLKAMMFGIPMLEKGEMRGEERQ